MLVGFNAAGDYTPRLVIQKGKRIQEAWRQRIPKDTTLAVSDNGWITSELFVNYLQGQVARAGRERACLKETGRGKERVHHPTVQQQINVLPANDLLTCAEQHRVTTQISFSNSLCFPCPTINFPCDLSQEIAMM